eukprot:2907737-Pyramimonas_sp.AAC.1
MRLLGSAGFPLATLVLRQCVYVTHEGVTALMPLAGSLKHLDLTACFRVGDAGVDTFVHFRALKELRLGETSRVTDQGLLRLAEAATEDKECTLGQTLTLLDLHECREVRLPPA